MNTRIARLLLGLMGCLGMAPAAWSETSWPEKPVTLVVPYGAGGSTDVFARVMATELQKRLGQPVIVANHPGAFGTIGPTYVSKQKPDGYTVGLVSDTTLILSPMLVKATLSIDDFEYTSAIYAPRFGIAVRADSPFQSMKDAVAAAKEQGRPVFFGSPGSFNSLLMFNLNRVSGAEFQEVPYKSGADVTTALLGGQVQLAIQNPSDILPQAETGKMRLLASAGEKRWPQQPSVPTLREMGYPVSADTTTAIGLPKGTPQAVVDKLDEAVRVIRADPAFQSKLNDLGFDMGDGTRQDYVAKLRGKVDFWKEAVARAGLGQKK